MILVATKTYLILPIASMLITVDSSRFNLSRSTLASPTPLRWQTIKTREIDLETAQFNSRQQAIAKTA